MITTKKSNRRTTEFSATDNVADFSEISARVVRSAAKRMGVTSVTKRSFHALPVGQGVPPERSKRFELLRRFEH